jgi:hypothetical protein
MAQQRHVAENKMQQTLRLLNELAERTGVKDPEYLKLEFETPFSGGTITYMREGGLNRPLLDFPDPEALEQFLTASPIDQMCILAKGSV